MEKKSASPLRVTSVEKVKRHCRFLHSAPFRPRLSRPQIDPTTLCNGEATAASENTFFSAKTAVNKQTGFGTRHRLNGHVMPKSSHAGSRNGRSSLELDSVRSPRKGERERPATAAARGRAPCSDPVIRRTNPRAEKQRRAARWASGSSEGKRPGNSLALPSA